MNKIFPNLVKEKVSLSANRIISAMGILEGKFEFGSTASRSSVTEQRDISLLEFYALERKRIAEEERRHRAFLSFWH